MSGPAERSTGDGIGEVRARLLAGLPVAAARLDGRAGRALEVARTAGAPAVPALDAAASARAGDVSRRQLVTAATAQARAVLVGMAAIPVLAIPALGGVLGRPLWPFYLTSAGAVVGLVGLSLAAVGILSGRWLVRRTQRTGPAHDEVADLVAVALSGGVPPAPALRLVARYVPSCADPLRRAATAFELGRPHEPDGELGAIVGALRLSARYGTPAAPALRQLADDLRAEELARVRAATQRLPAQLAFPTALCHLPATLLLVGAPLLAAGLEAATAGAT